VDSKKILIVEDEAIIALRIKATIEGLGHKVVERATTGAAALQSIERNRPDLVMMDIHLHGKMDGIETAEQIQAQYDIPIVYLTAHSEDTTLLRAKKTEPYAFLLKPFRDEDLRVAVDVALHKHACDQEKKVLSHALEQSLRQVKQLSGLLPICAWCKRIRRKDGKWQQIEAYVTENSEANFSHGVCDDCRNSTCVE